MTTRSYSCNGQGYDGKSCCKVNGQPCIYLRYNTAGRRFACQLMVEHGDWDRVVADPRYRHVGEWWQSRNQPFDYCASFDPAFCCRPEYRAGRRHETHQPTLYDYYLPRTG